MTQSECYGKMFPSVNSPRTDVPLRGKVFTAKLESAGGMAIATRTTGVDLDAWSECVKCPDFDHCYKLSMAKLALETGVMQN
jgi:hypothetical protein